LRWDHVAHLRLCRPIIIWFHWVLYVMRSSQIDEIHSNDHPAPGRITTPSGSCNRWSSSSLCRLCRP
jgi:hypothetical protein